MTGVHPPSPHPKFPMWQKTDNGWESTRRVTTPLTLYLLNKNEKKKGNTTSDENNDGEIKLELTKIIIIATTVAMKMIMGEVLSYNNNNDSTNKQIKSWSFRRQNLRNIKTSLYNNNTRLSFLESNRYARVKDISTSSVRTIMHSTEMNQGLKDDLLRIWNVVWKLGYIRCRDGLKLYAGKCNIWCTM